MLTDNSKNHNVKSLCYDSILTNGDQPKSPARGAKFVSLLAKRLQSTPNTVDPSEIAEDDSEVITHPVAVIVPVVEPIAVVDPIETVELVAVVEPSPVESSSQVENVDKFLKTEGNEEQVHVKLLSSAVPVSGKGKAKGVPLFIYGRPEKNKKLFDIDKLVGWSKQDMIVKDEGKTKYKDIHYVESTDTEWDSEAGKLNDIKGFSNVLKQRTRVGLSTQNKGIHPDAPRVLHWHRRFSDQLNQARVNVGLDPLPVVKSQAHFVDYINYCYERELAKICDVKPGEDLNKLPVFTCTMNAFFATAELLMVFEGKLKEEIRAWIKQKIIFARRNLCIENFANNSKKSDDWVQFETCVIEIDGIRFALRLRIIDTCAIHGVAGYADTALNVGLKLKYKDKLSKKDKAKMLDIALTRPKDFEDYALGDLDVYDILAMYDGKMREVYNILGIGEYYVEPALTIGATMRDLFCAMLCHKLSVGTEVKEGVISWKKDFDEQVKPFLNFNASEIREWTKNTGVLLSKVEGGRCRNNRPKATVIKRHTSVEDRSCGDDLIETISDGLEQRKDDIAGHEVTKIEIKFIDGKKHLSITYDNNIIIDIDISGCYGEGQRNQDFPLGEPATTGLDLRQGKGRYHEYQAFRKWLISVGVKYDVLVKAGKEKNFEECQNPENWGELVKGLWIARVKTSETLKYTQDLFASWFTTSGHGTDVMAKFIKNDLSTDSEVTNSMESVDFDEKYGVTKIFETEIHNGIITHDGLQWLLFIASDRQRNELLDKLTVVSSAYYPRSARIIPESLNTAIAELNSAKDDWKGRNTVVITDAKTGATQENYNSCHAWIGINLGELIIDKLLIERKRAQITHGKKSPLDQLFKLCINTLYGDLVSPYFVISNPIVGNNITARARALAWYMEKGFNGFESITDGCGFELNKVLFNTYLNRNEINGELINSVRDKKVEQRKIQSRPLGGYALVQAYWTEYTRFDKDKPEGVKELVLGLLLTDNDNNETDLNPIIKPDKDHPGFYKASAEKAMEWLDGKDGKQGVAMTHLQNLFPCVDVLHAPSTKLNVDKETLEAIYHPRIGQFSFETKDAYVGAAFHGSANYIFQKADGSYVIKMRSYETNKIHEAWEFGKDNTEDFKEEYETFLKSDRYGDENNPGKDFMMQLLANPKMIKRQQVAVKQGIFKTGEYAENSGKFDELGIEPGDSIIRCMLFQEFSLSQFTFKTYDQYMKWNKIIQNDKDENKQSIETFFLDSEGNLKFQDMIIWVADAIERGVMNPYEELDKNRHKERDLECAHPCLDDYIGVSKRLNKPEKKTDNELTEDEVNENVDNESVDSKPITSKQKSVKKGKKQKINKALEPE